MPDKASTVTAGNSATPILLKARETCAVHAEAQEYPSEAAKYRSGEYDDNAVMRASVAAYEREAS